MLLYNKAGTLRPGMVQEKQRSDYSATLGIKITSNNKISFEGSASANTADKVGIVLMGATAVHNTLLSFSCSCAFYWSSFTYVWYSFFSTKSIELNRVHIMSRG